MDILLGAGSGPLGKLLQGKNGALLLALLPVLLQLLSSQKSNKPARPSTKGKTVKKGKARRLGGDAGASGLDSLVGMFDANGLGEIVGSWVGGGPNKTITPAQVKRGLGADTVAEIADDAGVSVSDASKGLAVLLPVLVNDLTPKAEVPQPTALDMALDGLSGLLSGS